MNASGNNNRVAADDLQPNNDNPPIPVDSTDETIFNEFGETCTHNIQTTLYMYMYAVILSVHVPVNARTSPCLSPFISQSDILGLLLDDSNNLFTQFPRGR